MNMKVFALLAFLFVSYAAYAKHITITVAQQSQPNAPEATNEIVVAEGEVAEIKSFPYYANYQSHLILQKDNNTFWFNPGTEGLVFTGPAKLLLRASGGGGYGIATIKVEPESFPPDKTIIIPAGTGARITLESSTNLTHWTAIHTVSTTNSAANLFFRIKAERLNGQ
jgi:hypothetical protein